jgi:pentatricopeptide repeat protein
MSLGSRIARRARVACNASLASSPSEPLLFLYPQWARSSSSTTAKPVEQDGTPRTSSMPATSTFPDLFNLEGQLKPHGQHLRDPSSTLDESVKDQTVNVHREGLDDRRHRSRFKPTSGEKGVTESHRELTLSEMVVKKRRLNRRVERVFGRVDRAENSSRVRRDTERRLQQLRREELNREWTVDWRDILSDLNIYTPRHGPWMERALKIIVPDEAMGQLVHAIDGHLWDIGRTYDCSVDPDGSAGQSEECRAFILSGTAPALGKFMADVIRVAPNTEVMLGDKNPRDFSNSSDWRAKRSPSSGPVRLVVTRDPKLTVKIPAEKIPRPETWTSKSFLGYVEAVVDPDISNHIKRVGREDKNGEDSRMAHAAIVSNLFTDPKCLSSITKTACHEAMRFFIRINMIEDLRVLFVQMDTQKIKLDPETFNIMLGAAAKNGNLGAFRFILHLMLNRDLLPNSGTWIALMRAHSDVGIKIHIINAMKDKGILGNKSTVQRVCSHMVEHEIMSSLDQNQSHEDFIAHMDTFYTPHWLSVAASGRILHLLGSRGLISRCWEFLHFMHSRSVQPNTVCINTVLFHCKEQRNLSGAIEVLRSLPPTDFYTPNTQTFDRLFVMAWRAQNYNVIRVVWRYACLYAATSFMMRQRIFQSLREGGLQSEQNEPASGRARFRQLIGPVIFSESYHEMLPVQISSSGNVHDTTSPEAGHEPILDEASLLNISEDENTQDGFESLLFRTEDKAGLDGNKKSLSNLQALMMEDYTVYREWKPVKPMSQMLAEAAEKDKEWRQRDWEAKQRGEETGTQKELLAARQWMIKNAIDIEVQNRDKGFLREWK